MKNVMLLAGAGQIGMAIVRRMGAGMKIVVGDKKLENAQAIAKTMNEAGFDVVPMEMDLSSRDSIKALICEGQKHGEITVCTRAADDSKVRAWNEEYRDRQEADQGGVLHPQFRSRGRHSSKNYKLRRANCHLWRFFSLHQQTPA